MTERFTLLSELGRGGMGVVWKARDEETGQIVALKLLREAYAEDPEYLARFERELELARRIDSVHVVKVLGYGVREKVPYLALEYVDGPSLHAALVAHGPYSWPETRALLIQMTQGLADANAAGVIHRDVKPSNVLIGPDGVAKLTDFGIARGLDLTRMTATSTLLGTPAYMAPEGPKDARSDLYSLGIIGYELLTGAVPFKGTSYQEVVVDHIRTPPDLSKLPPEARDVVGWLLEKDPAVRPQRASALLPALYGATAAPAPSTVVAQPDAQAPDAWTQTAPTGVIPAQSGVIEQRSVGPIGDRQPPYPPPPGYRGLPPALSTPPTAARRNPASFGQWLTAAGLVVCLVLAVAVQSGLSGLLSHSTSSTSIPQPTVGQPQTPIVRLFSTTGSMTTARSRHSATLLSDGRVLIAGGVSNSGVTDSTSLQSAELYDPKTGKFVLTHSMHTGRAGHTATLLSDGRVLVAGGSDNSAEVYDPRSGTFTRTGSMGAARENQTATVLSDGRVLVVGGFSGNTALASSELYDPKTGTFSPTGSMAAARSDQTATLLSDGRVLVVGGLSGRYVGSALASAELYDPKTGTFSSTGSMATARYFHTATLLSDGRVLIVGGENGSSIIAAAELYDPKTGRFSPTGPTTTPRGKHTATLLSDGRVLIVGGYASTDLYDPESGTFSAAAPMATALVYHTATLLSDGRVLIVGGYVDYHCLASAELYTP
jgi:serine/threonine protein kinase